MAIQITQMPTFYSSLFQDLGLEILFLAVILTVSITIYKITKEPYQLTKHKGIKYFRNAFLFLGIAYTFRLLFYLLSYAYNYKLVFYLDLPPRMLGGGSMFVYTFMSSISLLSLLYALSYNKFKDKIPEYLIYLSGAAISLASFFNFAILWLTHSLIAVMIVIFVLFQKNKAKNTLGVAYVGLVLFWILGILGDLFYFSALNFFRPILYSIITIILLFISFKTVKRVN